MGFGLKSKGKSQAINLAFVSDEAAHYQTTKEDYMTKLLITALCLAPIANMGALCLTVFTYTQDSRVEVRRIGHSFDRAPSV